MTVYNRPGTRFFWIVYSAHGQRFSVSAKTANRREALRREREILKSVANGTWAPPGRKEDPRVTVEQYATTWHEGRKRRGIRTAGAEWSRLRMWVLPRLGAMALEDVTRQHLVELTRGLSESVSEETGKVLAPRTQTHVYDAVRLMFADAVADGIIGVSPATLMRRRGELPKKRDADPRWREGAAYTRTEVEALVGDPSIPLDRRVYYALMALGGLRSAEAAGVRWRDYDPKASPLGRLLVATQVTADKVERETKTALPRRVPVHPVLAEMLTAWRREGWPQFNKRHPTDDDLIVPSRSGGARSGSKGRERLLDDLKRLGFRNEGRARHALRATFISFCDEDGAIPAIIDLVVWAKASSVRAGYQRFPWAALCSEVAKLRIEPKAPAAVTFGLGARGRPLQDMLQSPEVTALRRENDRGGGIRSTAPAREDNGKAPRDGAERRKRGA